MSNRNYSSPVLRVDNLNGHPWLVRLVRPGDRYGAEFCLVHGEPKKNQPGKFRLIPMVEFYSYKKPAIDYDFTGSREEAEKSGAPELGQYVSRYYLDTFVEVAEKKLGLNLCGYVPDWQVDFALVERVAKWLDHLLELPPSRQPAYSENLDTYGQ